MPTDIQTLKNALKQKDHEIKELKQMLAEAEGELREYSSSDHMERPRASILESRGLNRVIKGTFYFLLCAIIIIAGLYPWFFKDKIFGTSQEPVAENNDNVADEPVTPSAETATPSADTTTNATTTPPVTPEPARDIFQPEKKMVEVSSDLGWLNVRTNPGVENSDVIKKINSGESFEWMEKTDNNWYKIVIDDAGHTGYVSGEYVVEK
jgi:hypothetical protein